MVVHKCLRCGKKRDVRVEDCPYCGCGLEDAQQAEAYTAEEVEVFIDSGFIEPSHLKLPIDQERAGAARVQECALLGVEPTEEDLASLEGLSEQEQTIELGESEHAARELEMLAVQLCTACGLRRDRRVDFCKVCGADNRLSSEIEIPMPPITPSVYMDPDFPYEAAALSNGPRSLDELRNIGAAHNQESATRRGEVLSAEGALQLYDEEVKGAKMSPATAAMVFEFMRTGPGASGKWEANAFGLSGRVIRGYRHWRHKR